MGRGEYYKNRYGRGSRGGRGQRSNNSHHCRDECGDDKDNHAHPNKRENKFSNRQELKYILLDLDRKPYNFYKDLYGFTFDFERIFSLKFDHVQGDPYASPSRICVTLPLQNSRFPDWSWSNSTRTVALADYICRRTVGAISDQKADYKARGSWHDGKGGELRIEHPSQNMLLRTSVEVKEENILLRFCVGLPAKGRNICGHWAADICTNTVHNIVIRACCGESTDKTELQNWVESYEDQEALRKQLSAAQLIAFVPDGAILPRSAGHLDTPHSGRGVVSFQSPPSLKVTLKCPNKGSITGMGIKPGVTLIAGGGFHGKTTLLSALKLGIYSKIPGDGREYLVTTPSATKIRAEDGRQITGVDISNFINNLPQKKDTSKFYSCDASGSTSQAAAIMEYLELGGNCLMIDEDTAATNFMIRDDKMQMLLSADKEPIKPYLYRARELHDKMGVSSILVVGGAGDYLDVADTVLLLDNYTVVDVTSRAKEIAASHPAHIPSLPPMIFLKVAF
ncbi:uncharacterized protein LOC134826784 [Bolinopsis microptera]|uniref:uncharacterized protein LOC134826784 n=1 Tax=Bolinopsis microptera TaxID=2820187 RepID=UPI003078E5C7